MIQNPQNKNIDKKRIFLEAKEYSEKRMEIPKKKVNVRYIAVILVLIFLVMLFFLSAIFYRHYLFLQMGL